MERAKALLWFISLTAALPDTAHATEAAAGRYIPGVFAVPTAGVLPPPGIYWSASTAFYSGSISADIPVPVAGEVTLGLDALIAGETFTGVFVPPTEIAPGVSIAFSLSVPVQYVKATATLGDRELTQDQVALGDIAFGPRVGWHSGANFFSVGVNIFAPTGAWENGALDNVGMNYWSFSPTVAYTYLDAEHGIDFSVNAGVDLNTVNPDTDYQSGAVGHVDALVMKSFTQRFSAGVFGSVLYQIEDDTGGIADRFDGFKGRSYAIGPILKYTAGSEENPISVSLSWAPEFGVRNRPEGNAVYLSVAGKF